jgi:murein L,D-transpeptidase YafK
MMMLQAAHVVVLKKERRLELLSEGKLIKTYKVALGSDPIGPIIKSRQRDHKTPEGSDVLDSRNPHSQFYKSFHISCPSARDSAQANQGGFSPGGDADVHGLPNGYRYIGAAADRAGILLGPDPSFRA